MSASRASFQHVAPLPEIFRCSGCLAELAGAPTQVFSYTSRDASNSNPCLHKVCAACARHFPVSCPARLCGKRGVPQADREFAALLTVVHRRRLFACGRCKQVVSVANTASHGAVCGMVVTQQQQQQQQQPAPPSVVAKATYAAVVAPTVAAPAAAAAAAPPDDAAAQRKRAADAMQMVDTRLRALAVFQQQQQVEMAAQYERLDPRRRVAAVTGPSSSSSVEKSDINDGQLVCGRCLTRKPLAAYSLSPALVNAAASPITAILLARSLGSRAACRRRCDLCVVSLGRDSDGGAPSWEPRRFRRCEGPCKLLRRSTAECFPLATAEVSPQQHRINQAAGGDQLRNVCFECLPLVRLQHAAALLRSTNEPANRRAVEAAQRDERTLTVQRFRDGCAVIVSAAMLVEHGRAAQHERNAEAAEFAVLRGLEQRHLLEAMDLSARRGIWAERVGQLRELYNGATAARTAIADRDREVGAAMAKLGALLQSFGEKETDARIDLEVDESIERSNCERLLNAFRTLRARHAAQLQALIDDEARARIKCEDSCFDEFRAESVASSGHFSSVQALLESPQWHTWSLLKSAADGVARLSVIASLLEAQQRLQLQWHAFAVMECLRCPPNGVEDATSSNGVHYFCIHAVSKDTHRHRLVYGLEPAVMAMLKKETASALSAAQQQPQPGLILLAHCDGIMCVRWSGPAQAIPVGLRFGTSFDVAVSRITKREVAMHFEPAHGDEDADEGEDAEEDAEEEEAEEEEEEEEEHVEEAEEEEDESSYELLQRRIAGALRLRRRWGLMLNDFA